VRVEDELKTAFANAAKKADRTDAGAAPLGCFVASAPNTTRR
jgi:hypothetical protein